MEINLWEEGNGEREDFFFCRERDREIDDKLMLQLEERENALGS